MSSTDTGSTVLDWLVCQREVTQVVADHFWLDFNLQEGKLVRIFAQSNVVSRFS